VNLNELFRRLSYGELSNLSIGAEGVGMIKEDAQPRIINYANEALLRLHSRFLLRENILFFEQTEHLTYYYMLKRFARSQLTDPPCPNTPHLYILDNEDEPFENDLIKVMQVIDEDSCVIPLNDLENVDSIFTPQPNLIQIPKPVAGKVLAVEYQARHPELSLDDNGCSDIDLPYVLEGALTAFIAYKVYSHMNGPENGAKAAEYMAIYEGIVAEVTAQDTVSQSKATTTLKFYERGFI
jgi:hypothetical protein